MAKGATAPSHNTSDTNDTSDTSDISNTVARELLARDSEGDGGGGGGVGHLKADMHVRAKYEMTACGAFAGQFRKSWVHLNVHDGQKVRRETREACLEAASPVSSNRQGAASFLLSVADE
jgi:hypothetical protein